MLLSVIIPVYNEEKTVGELLRRVIAEKTPKEIIVIDDGSRDRTWDVIQNSRLRRGFGGQAKFKILENERNIGKGYSIRRGIKEARGDVLIIQDADLEYNPDYYKRLIEPILKKEALVVYGSRLKEMEFILFGKNKTPLPLHYLANRFLSWLTNILYGSDLTDIETGYKVMAREVYKKLSLDSDRFEIEPEITAKILRLGYQITEVPITTIPRTYKEGKKIKAKDAFTALISLFRYLK